MATPTRLREKVTERFLKYAARIREMATPTRPSPSAQNPGGEDASRGGAGHRDSREHISLLDAAESINVVVQKEETAAAAAGALEMQPLVRERGVQTTLEISIASGSRVQEYLSDKKPEMSTDGRSLQADEWADLQDSAAVKNYIHRAIREAAGDPALIAAMQAGWADLDDQSDPMKAYIKQNARTTVRNLMDRFQLVKDGLSDHLSLSRIMYGISLTFPVALFIGMATNKKDGNASPQELAKIAVIMASCFVMSTACYCYLLIFHFVRTSAPRVSTSCSRWVACMMGGVSLAWFACITLIVPSVFYRAWLWGITGPFIVFNGLLAFVIAYQGFVTEDKIMEF